MRLAEMNGHDYEAIVLYLQRAGPALQSLSFEKNWGVHFGNAFLFPVSYLGIHNFILQAPP
jgi:hypothetical protein